MHYVLATVAVAIIALGVASSVAQKTIKSIDSITFTQDYSDICSAYAEWKQSQKDEAIGMRRICK